MNNPSNIQLLYLLDITMTIEPDRVPINLVYISLSLNYMSNFKIWLYLRNRLFII